MAGVSVLCAVLVLLLVGWLLKCAQGRWLAPGPLFALYWAAGLGLPPVFAPRYIQSQGAVWYIVLLVGAFGLGSIAAAQRRPVRRPGGPLRPLNQRLLRQVVAAGTAAGLSATVVVQVANGYSVGSILSAQALLDAAAAFSIDRYTGQSRTPVLVPLLMSLTYAAALLAPFAARGLRRRSAVACYAGPFVAATLYAILTTARAGMLLVAFFLFAGWIVAALREGGEVPRLRPRAVFAVAASFAALAGAFVSIAFLRVGSFDPTAQRAIGPKMVGYAVGYMPAFSRWLEESAPTGPRGWGTATFAGLVNVADGETAAFGEHAPLGPGLGFTNIFTAWRYLVEDFGFAGAPVAAFVLGWLITWAWRRVAQQPSTMPLVVLLSGYAYILNSTTQTVFLFTNIVLAVVIAAWALSRRPLTPKPVVESEHVRAARRARETAGQHSPPR